MPVPPRIPIPKHKKAIAALKKDCLGETDLDEKNAKQKGCRTKRDSSTSKANSRGEATKLCFSFLAVAFREAAV
jgi:hypothetical protein